MIDFTKCEQLKRGYAGANGNKISIRYHDEIYMLKFPSGGKLNPNMHYTNAVYLNIWGVIFLNWHKFRCRKPCWERIMMEIRKNWL